MMTERANMLNIAVQSPTSLSSVAMMTSPSLVASTTSSVTSEQLTTNVSDCHVPSDVIAEQHSFLIIFLSISAVILMVGLVCNALAIVVCLTSGAIRSSTTGHFLVAISAADLLYITGDVLRALNTSVLGRHYILGVDFMDTYSWLCKLIYYLRYAGIFSCSWLTVAITTERFITVSMPLEVSRISTSSKVNVIIAAIFALSLTLGAFPLWTVGVEYDSSLCRHTCTVLDPVYYIWWDIWVRYLSLFAASAIIFVLVGLILFFLRRAFVRRRMITEGQRVQNKSDSSRNRKSIERQLTAMFLGMALAFILLRLPYIVMFEIHDNRESIWDQPGPELTKIVYILLKVSDLLFLSHYSANFFLYCLCGSVFRRHTVHLLRHLSRKRTVTTSLRGDSVPMRGDSVPLDEQLQR